MNQWSPKISRHIEKIPNFSYCFLSLTPRSTDNIEVSKRAFKHYDYNFNDFLRLRDSQRLLRSSDCLRFDNKKPKKKFCRNSFFYRTGALINRLPKSVIFKFLQGLKHRFLGYLGWYFNDKYTESLNNTWSI